MLEVGVNSYMDLDEANKIVNTNFMSDDPMRLFWNKLSDDDKQILILSTTIDVDTNSMLYKGYKRNINQPLQFPRIDNYGNVIECPNRVKIGIVKQALRQSYLKTSDEYKLKELGIKSFADGSGASISFDTNNTVTTKTKQGVYKDLWFTYFSDYSFLV